MLWIFKDGLVSEQQYGRLGSEEVFKQKSPHLVPNACQHVFWYTLWYDNDFQI